MIVFARELLFFNFSNNGKSYLFIDSFIIAQTVKVIFYVNYKLLFSIF